MDAAETLTFDIANKVATHLMLPGSDPGRNGRLVVMQADLRRLNLILIEVFKLESGAPARVPKAIGTCRTELWEFATGGLASDPDRAAFSHDHPAIKGALVSAQNLVSIARGKLAKTDI